MKETNKSKKKLQDNIQRNFFLSALKGLRCIGAPNNYSNKYSLLEKDHLGDWRPEKDCC